MRKIVLLAALALPAFTATASAATIPVNSLTGDFSATNSTVTLVGDGVHFGTYADGGVIGGSLVYTGANGATLASLTNLTYTFSYRQAGSTTGAAPYLRVFLADTNPAVDRDGDGDPTNDENDVILDPSFCATTTPAQATTLSYNLVGNSVRYNDDGCDGTPPDNQPYADVVAAHGNEIITGIVVTQGFSTGTDVSALLTSLRVNDDTFVFGGVPGAGGAAGQPGAPGQTIIINQPGAGPQGAVAGAAAGASCTGNILRTLRAATRKGERFLSARASLRGKTLTVSGRKITVDLRNRKEGNYNVQITARYRKANGKVRVARTQRPLSVVCA